MIYKVAYSAGARQDLRDIYKYIAFELQEPDTAAGQTRRIMKAARSLNEMPMRHKLYEEEPWYSLGMRFVPVDNYLIFYLPDQRSNTAGCRCTEFYTHQKGPGEIRGLLVLISVFCQKQC